MLKKLKDFDNQLTCYCSQDGLQFAIKQLKKYGSKEGKDFVVKQQGEKFAVFINYKAYVPNVIYQIK